MRMSKRLTLGIVVLAALALLVRWAFQPCERRVVAPLAPSVSLEAEVALPPAVDEVRGSPEEVVQASGFDVVVLDQSEKPISGAKVFVELAREDGAPPEKERGFGVGESGTCRIAGLEHGEYQLRAWHPRHWSESRKVSVPPEEPVVFQLKPAASIEGRVFAHDREHPLGNVDLSMTIGREHGWSRTYEKTRPDGSFDTGPVHSGNYVTFRAKPYQPLTLTFELNESKPAKGLEILLEPGIAVHGIAHNREGTPLPKLELKWSREHPAGVEDMSCITDKEGRFEMSGLFADRYTVKPECLHSEKAEADLSEEPTQELDLVFDLLPQTWIAVKDVQGLRVSGATVSWVYNAARGSASAGGKTDENGQCSLLPPPTQGRLTIRAEKEGVGAARRNFDLDADHGPFEIRLVPNGVVEGRVVGRGGEGIAASHVRWWPGWHDFETFAGADGRFRLELAEGTYHFEALAGLDGIAAAEGVEVRPGEATNVALAIDPSKCIRGRVLDCEGRPESKASVVLRPLKPRPGRDRIDPPFSVDEGGSFAVLAEPGEYEVRAFRVQPRAYGAPFRAQPGDPPIDITTCFDVERKANGQVLHQGKPAASAQVRCFNATAGGYLLQDDWRNHTGHDGRFEVVGLDADMSRAIFVASGPEFSFARSEEVDVPPDGVVSGVVIESVLGEDLELHLRQPNGRPAGDTPVYLRGDGMPPVEIEGHTDDDGVFRVPRLPPGEYYFDSSTPWARSTPPHPEARILSWGPGVGPIEVEVPAR
jgi:hypothetical protein